MEYYNLYINKNKNYVSEIAFVNANPAIISRALYYVEFVKGGKTGRYLDNNDYLKKLYWDIRKTLGSFTLPEDIEQEYLKRTSGFIRNIQPSVSFFSYIKILEDKQNPQLEGQIMLFKYGRKIKFIMEEYLVNNTQNFDKTFEIVVRLSSGFPNYDKCHFTDKDINIFDKTLNLDSDISFKMINILSIQRKEKLRKIQNL